MIKCSTDFIALRIWCSSFLNDYIHFLRDNFDLFQPRGFSDVFFIVTRSCWSSFVNWFDFLFPRSELPVSVFYCEMFLRVTQSRSRREPSSSSSSSHLTCQNDIFIQSIWCFCSARLHDGHVSDDWIFKCWEWMIFQPHDASCEESIIRSGTTTATVGSLTEPIQKLSQVY